MNYKPIVIIAGEPNSVFFEIFLKSINNKKIKSPIILIGSKKLFDLQMNFLKKKIKFKILDYKILNKKTLYKSKINLIDVDYQTLKPFDKITNKSKKYIEECFKIALYLIKKKLSNKLINGPISKKNFLDKRYNGITEYLASKTSTKIFAMLIYNKKLSVCPISTHIPLKHVNKKINKKEIINKIKLINKFYKEKFNHIPRIAVTGLNPHCESTDSFKEEEKIIKPSIRLLRKLNYKVSGPYSADTIFLKDNRKKFDVIVGMYHDQVLTPIKTLFEYDAINITLGLPFLRISPDHGPNVAMLGKNISNPLSLFKAINFLDIK